MGYRNPSSTEQRESSNYCVSETLTWQDDVLNGMRCEDFVDCHLVGTDGVQVPCTKLFLASQSPYFKTLFFGNFKQQGTHRCHIHYPSRIIRVLVQFCHTGRVDLSLILDEAGLRETEISLLVELRDAGRYFKLDKVVSCSEQEIKDVVFRHHDVRCACVVLEELMSRSEEEGPFWTIFFRCVVENARECFCPDFKLKKRSTCIAEFKPTPRLLAMVLDQTNDAHAIVRCIQEYFHQESSLDRESTSAEEESLKAISKRVDLKALSTVQLSKIQPCALFPAERILEAFVHHDSLSSSYPIPDAKDDESAGSPFGDTYKCPAEPAYHPPPSPVYHPASPAWQPTSPALPSKSPTSPAYSPASLAYGPTASPVYHPTSPAYQPASPDVSAGSSFGYTYICPAEPAYQPPPSPAYHPTSPTYQMHLLLGNRHHLHHLRNRQHHLHIVPQEIHHLRCIGDSTLSFSIAKSELFSAGSTESCVSLL